MLRCRLHGGWIFETRLQHGQVIQSTIRRTLSTAELYLSLSCTTSSNRQLHIYSQQPLHSTHFPLNTLSPLALGWTRSNSISLHHSIFGRQLSLLRNRTFSTADNLYPRGIKGQRWHSTSSIRPTPIDNETHSMSNESVGTTSKENQSRSKEGFQLIYTAPFSSTRQIK